MWRGIRCEGCEQRLPAQGCLATLNHPKFQEEGEGADRGKVEGGGCGVGDCTSPAVELLLW